MTSQVAVKMAAGQTSKLLRLARKNAKHTQSVGIVTLDIFGTPVEVRVTCEAFGMHARWVVDGFIKAGKAEADRYLAGRLEERTSQSLELQRRAGSAVAPFVFNVR